MTSSATPSHEAFEQVLATARASGSLNSAWQKFVHTQFFVPVLRTADDNPRDFTLDTSAQPDGESITISEVGERLDQKADALATLSGAVVVRMLPADAAIVVALSQGVFTIPADCVEWLKVGIEAAQAKAATNAAASEAAAIKTAEEEASKAATAVRLATEAALRAPPATPAQRTERDYVVRQERPPSEQAGEPGIPAEVPEADRRNMSQGGLLDCAVTALQPLLNSRDVATRAIALRVLSDIQRARRMVPGRRKQDKG
jgi:hypothetical protein